MDDRATSALPELGKLLDTLNKSTVQANDTLTQIETLLQTTRQIVEQSRAQLSKSDATIRRMTLCGVLDCDDPD